jgi:aspartate racemase
MKDSRMNETGDRIIGILGGMGPEATVDLYRHIINLTPVTKDQDHIKVIIYSNPKIPDRTEAIVAGGESPLPYLIESAQFLEKGGAGIIAIPCNTAHHYLKEIQIRTAIPVLNMIEETRRNLCEFLPGIQTVGLLAIDGTLRSGVYHRAMAESGVKILVSDDWEQKRVQSAIARIKAGISDRSIQEIFESAAIRLIEAGAQAIILGCTEVPLAFNPDTMDRPCLNPTRILAQAAVDWALGKREGTIIKD